MNIVLKDFQEEAVERVLERLRNASAMASPTNHQAVVLAAATGAGKTVIATRVIERILTGDDIAEPDPEATFLWVTDLPELNEQTAEKIRATSEVLGGLTTQIIDSDFDQPALLPGRVYFLNTQKLGTDKRLVTVGDGRTHSIWHTIDNTIDEFGSRFYVVIDEAHRGMRNRNGDSTTIIQRFIKGSNEMQPAPVVLGISATPQRFDALLEGTNRGVNRWEVPVEDVRDSGLLKDRILLYHSDDDQRADLTLLREATHQWMRYADRWEAYAKDEDDGRVEPILVVQVVDKAKGEDVAAAIDAINDALVDPLPSSAFAHSFDTGVVFDADGRPLRYLAPSRIVHDRDVRVVFFKTALSTGWDCPRAEVMMSFRKAKDATFIAQLIGRMVRTPLARRIESDETLNDVSLFLPYYDSKSLESVIAHLSDPDHDYVPPVDVLKGSESVELVRAEGTEELFTTLEKLPTYVVPRKRKVRQTRRLLKLARALSDDGIEDRAVEDARKTLVARLMEHLVSRREDEGFMRAVEGKESISYGLWTYDMRSDTAAGGDGGTLATSAENIDHLFQSAGRVVGDGLEIDLLGKLIEGRDDPEVIRRAKVEVAVLLSDPDVRDDLENTAQKEVNQKRGPHDETIKALPANRRETYREVAAMAPDPEEESMSLPIVLEGKANPDLPNLERHVFVDTDGNYSGKLNRWETATLEAALESAAGWLRNLPRKPWALSVPYTIKGDHKPMYPDLIVMGREAHRVVIDILDPHDPGRDDAAPKAQGMAIYAERHGHLFRRIWLIANIDGSFRHLDLNEPAVRDAVKGASSSNELKTLYTTIGIAGLG